MIPLLLLAAALSAKDAPAKDAPPKDAKVECNRLAASDPAVAERAARANLGTGGATARQCLGLALAAQDRFAEAAAAFTDAAHAGELSHDQFTADYWSQAGNAWLAASDAAKARAALDAALAAGTLDGLKRGETYLDRARALVATGELKAARIDLDHAIVDADADPLAWLLSATLARREGDLPRAKADIARAVRLAPDDASVQLEAGNIAGAGGDAEAAKTAWGTAVRLAPETPAGRSAADALKQFD